MADTFIIDETFNITIENDTSFWSSPLNVEPYHSELPAGEYNVIAVFNDPNGNLWYQLDLPTTYGVAGFIPANGNHHPTTDEDGKIRDGVLSTDDYLTYAENRRNDALDTANANIETAAEVANIPTVPNTSVSSNFTLITVSDAQSNVNTTDVFQYYIEKTRTTFGLPPQWNKKVDIQFKIPSSDIAIGRVYSQTIYANPTIISLTPGDIEMVTDNDKLMDILTGGTSFTTEAINAAAGALGTGESFFRFVDRWDDYITFLNETNKFLTMALGYSKIRKESGEDMFALWPAPAEMFIDKSPCAYRDIDFKNVLGSVRAIGGDPMHAHWLNFSIAGQISSQDAFSTSTRSTALENLINNNFSDTARDLYFMLGGKTVNTAERDIQQVIAEATSELGSGFSEILKAAGDIIKGGHVEFPQVIDDCTYGKTLSVQLRFVSPYGDIESRYLNVLLPYIILFTLAAPRQLSSKYDMYMYPFIVKASCKGVFACESGVITRLEVVRGGSQETEWTADGHPTAIDVQLEITPLHSKLMQSINDGLMIKNTGLQHYLGSICGVDMTVDTKTIMLETAKMLLDPTHRSGLLQTGIDNLGRIVDRAIQEKLPFFSAIRSLGIFSE